MTEPKLEPKPHDPVVFAIIEWYLSCLKSHALAAYLGSRDTKEPVEQVFKEACMAMEGIAKNKMYYSPGRDDCPMIRCPDGECRPHC